MVFLFSVVPNLVFSKAYRRHEVYLGIDLLLVVVGIRQSRIVCAFVLYWDVLSLLPCCCNLYGFIYSVFPSKFWRLHIYLLLYWSSGTETFHLLPWLLLQAINRYIQPRFFFIVQLAFPILNGLIKPLVNQAFVIFSTITFSSSLFSSTATAKYDATSNTPPNVTPMIARPRAPCFAFSAASSPRIVTAFLRNA